MIMMMPRESILEWLSREIPEYGFSQIAAQVLFQCQNCGECCRGEGYALLDEGDLRAMARELQISPGQAKTRFTHPDPQGNFACRILKSVGKDRDCCFLDIGRGECRIYRSRPRVCRTFPMLSSDLEGGQAIFFYPDCLGTAHFVRMILEKRDEPSVKKDVERLEADEELRDILKIKLFVWMQELMGEVKGAREISRMACIGPPSRDGSFERECLAYFLLTISTEGIEEYRYEDSPVGRMPENRIKKGCRRVQAPPQVSQSQHGSRSQTSV